MQVVLRAGKVPVTVRPSFGCALVATGLLLGARSLGAMLAWFALASASVMVAVLGQAFVHGTYGVRPHIVLWLLGGTVHGPRLQRGQRATVALAGPAAALLMGLPLLALHLRGVVAPGVGADLLRLAVTALVGLAAVSLLPLWPLAGGEVLAAALGARGARIGERRAARLGVLLGGVVVVVLVLARAWPAALLLGSITVWTARWRAGRVHLPTGVAAQTDRIVHQ
jgi:hypothetical protein